MTKLIWLLLNDKISMVFAGILINNIAPRILLLSQSLYLQLVADTFKLVTVK